MRKLRRWLWQFAYLFRKPRTKSGLMKMLARTRGLPYEELKLAKTTDTPLFVAPLPGGWKKWADQNQQEIDARIPEILNRR